MSEDLIKIIQTASNPFRKTNVKSAWEEEIFDVESINQKCFNEVLAEIEEISKGVYDSFIHLILGEVGLGKTHFLARLRKKALSHDFYFVGIEPVPNIDKFFIHILRELSWNLRKKIPDSDFSFLEHLVANLLFKQMEKALKDEKKFRTLLKELHRSPTRIFKLKSARENLDEIKQIMIPKISQDYPGIEIQLVQILFEAIDPKKFLYAIKWLQCESLAEEEMKLIEVSESIDEENLAFSILKSLLILSDKIVVFAFDQIESIEKSFGVSGLQKFFQQIVHIYNTCKNHLSLIMVQTGIWDSYVRGNLDKSVTDRIENTSKMEKLNIEQSEQIIEKRLENIWKRAKKPPRDPIYPFSKDLVHELANKSAWNPRELIKKASAQFKTFQISLGPEKLPPREIADEEVAKDENEFLDSTLKEFEEKYHVEYLNSSVDKRKDIIISVLFQIGQSLRNNQIKFYDFNVINCEINKIFERGRKGINLFLEIGYSGQNKKLGIECNNDKHMLRLYHSLNKLKAFQEANYFDKSILIREKDIPIKRSAEKTFELFEWIQNNDGFFEVQPKTNIRLYAMKKLLDAASAGELSFNERSTSYEEIIQILVKSTILTLDIIESFHHTLNVIFGLSDSSDKNLEQKYDLTEYEEQIWDFITKKKILGLKTIAERFPFLDEDQLKVYLKSLEKKEQISIEGGPNHELLICFEFKGEKR